MFISLWLYFSATGGDCNQKEKNRRVTSVALTIYGALITTKMIIHQNLEK
jgi:hypothetical protein